MGLISAIRRTLSGSGSARRRAPARRGPAESVAGPLAANAHRKSEELPGFYALPWQTGRPMAGKVSMSRMTEHHSGWVYAAVRAIAQGCASCDMRFTTSRARGRTRGRRAVPSGGPGRPSPEAAPATHAAESPRSLPLTDDHPLLGLFAHVNPFRTYRELLESTVTDLELCGNEAPHVFIGPEGLCPLFLVFGEGTERSP